MELKVGFFQLDAEIDIVTIKKTFGLDQNAAFHVCVMSHFCKAGKGRWNLGNLKRAALKP